MKDPHIRHLLRQTELLQYLNDPHSKVVEELKVPAAKARIDMAVINGAFHGYEIKSASDTLQRLPSQLIAYSYIFDYLTVVTEDKYYERVLKLIPQWVGLSVCVDNSVKTIQPSNLNPSKNGFHIAKLLWNEELIDILTALNIPFKKKQRNWLLCEILAHNVEIETLSLIVRNRLKARSDWKIKEGCAIM
ncbi:MAG: sce7726 family protein [Bacteroidetes bacterium]|nr:sce7726 family protein [Bacteroidota bacterium]